MVETLGGVPAHEELAEGVCRSGSFEEYEGNIFHIIDQLFDEIASDPSKLSDFFIPSFPKRSVMKPSAFFG